MAIELDKKDEIRGLSNFDFFVKSVDLLEAQCLIGSFKKGAEIDKDSFDDVVTALLDSIGKALEIAEKARDSTYPRGAFILWARRRIKEALAEITDDSIILPDGKKIQISNIRLYDFAEQVLLLDEEPKTGDRTKAQNLYRQLLNHPATRQLEAIDRYVLSLGKKDSGLKQERIDDDEAILTTEQKDTLIAILAKKGQPTDWLYSETTLNDYLNAVGYYHDNPPKDIDHRGLNNLRRSLISLKGQAVTPAFWDQYPGIDEIRVDQLIDVIDRIVNLRRSPDFLAIEGVIKNMRVYSFVKGSGETYETFLTSAQARMRDAISTKDDDLMINTRADLSAGFSEIDSYLNGMKLNYSSGGGITYADEAKDSQRVKDTNGEVVKFIDEEQVRVKKVQEAVGAVEVKGATTATGETKTGIRTRAEKMLDPHNRKDWWLEDYFSYLANTLQATVGQSGGVAVEVATEVRAKINGIENKENKENMMYWQAKLATYDMLIKAESPSGKDYSIQLDNIKGAPTFKFEREIMLRGFQYHSLYGENALKVIELIKVILQERKGKYAAKKLGPSIVDEFEQVVKDRVISDLHLEVLPEVNSYEEYLEQNEILKTGSSNVIPAHVVDTAINFAHSTAARDTYFIDDTAEAVTKGFGGNDHTELFKTEATVAYDINRYGRGPKPTYLILAVGRLPQPWSMRAAENNRQLDDVEDRTTQSFKDKMEVAKEEGKGRVKKVKEEEDSIREWVYTFFPEEEWKKAIALAVRGCIKNGKYELIEDPESIKESPTDSKFCFDWENEPALIKIDDEYYFQEKGATFPTFFDIMQAKKRDFNDDGKLEVNFELQRYFVAWDGWEKVVELVKEEPKLIDVDSAEKAIDDFHAAMGKAKIVPGRHHNMMNVYSLIYYTKIFKWLNPPTGTEYMRLKNKVLDKVKSQDTSPSGGGIPKHVKVYLTWLLEQDYLKPKQLSVAAVAHYEAHEKTKDLQGWRSSLAKATSWLESITEAAEPMTDNKPSGAYKIPDSPINWRGTTSVKEDEKK